MKISNALENGLYNLYHPTEKEPVLVYLYLNPDTDTRGFGFNIKDGYGFLPLDGVSSKSWVQPVVVTEPCNTQPYLESFDSDESCLKETQDLLQVLLQNIPVSLSLTRNVNKQLIAIRIHCSHNGKGYEVSAPITELITKYNSSEFLNFLLRPMASKLLEFIKEKEVIINKVGPYENK